MSLSHAIRITLCPLLLSSIAFALSLTPTFAQSSESDLTTQPAGGSANSRSGETLHHEAGSVEASGPALRDKLFLREATKSGRSETKLSELALSKTSDAGVKQLAGSIIADHTKISEGLNSAAESQGVMLPTKASPREQAVFERLNALSGGDFDREYLKAIMEDHTKDLHNFRLEAASTQDIVLRDVVQNALAMLHHHMVLADQIARTTGIQTTHPGRVVASSPLQQK